MNDIDFRLIAAEQKAADLIAEFGICAPEHIRLKDIAYKKNAMVVEKWLSGAAASIVKLGERATIRISPEDSIERKRFSIGHELGHFLLKHVEATQRICSNDDMNNWHQSSQETQANFFASELILPTTLVAPLCDVKNVCIDPIQAIAQEFRASLTATAIKFVRLCPEKCAVIYSTNGEIKWFYKSPDWWPFIRQDKKLDKRTLAYDFFSGVPMDTDPQEVDADAWIESKGLDEVVEHSIASTRYGFVLSVLWIRPN